jgi:hypothetical protein
VWIGIRNDTPDPAAAPFGTKPVLGVMVVVMVTMVGRVLVVMLRGEGRTRKDQQEQDGGKNLLHGENVPRVRR